MSANGGLSKEEFLVLQQQLIALRKKNYELQEDLQKKNNEIAQLNSPRSEALQFANKLINRRDKEKDIVKKYEAELDAQRMKLASQEEEFRLQQETLISELNKIVSQNESMRQELDHFKALGSIYSSPQAGTPCDSYAPFMDSGETRSRSDYISLSSSPPEEQCTPTYRVSSGQSTAHISTAETAVQTDSDQEDQSAVVHALECKLLEYRDEISKLTDSTSELLRENARLQSTISGKAVEITSLMDELKHSRDIEEEHEAFASRVMTSLSTVLQKLGVEDSPTPDHSTDRNLLENKISAILNQISCQQEKSASTLDEMVALQQEKIAAQSESRELQEQLQLLKSSFGEERNGFNEKIRELSDEVQLLRESHGAELQSLEGKIATLEDGGDKALEDRVLLVETRYQLELAEREKAFEAEKEGLERKVRSLETSLKAKDDEKMLALKKQAAVVKELQRTLREERKRVENMEKTGRCSSEERGWHLVGESDAKSAQTLDAVDSRSVSSVSALESDNVELINRLTSLQHTHADVMDRVIILENENARLVKEINEKNELIEHWIRRRPLTQNTGMATLSRQEGGLRKFLTSALSGDEATNDIKEMNKKLQRMLEETLSKNIILQRDLQTLLERTEM
ncbi:hypothetical protein Q1695_006106 [Nippostrongylus brasiliensis]|nr:hypothetical protein Q1695_006106 [Nippostrongylus brasiliensis]